MTIGERIKKMRENNDLYQEDLAKKIGVSRQTIASWEQDRTVPNIDKTNRMAEVFKCDIKEITGEDMDIRSRANNNKEFTLLENFRKADKMTQQMVMRLLLYSNFFEDNNYD